MSTNLEREFALWKLGADKEIEEYQVAISKLQDDIQRKKMIAEGAKERKQETEVEVKNLREEVNMTTSSNLRKIAGLRMKEKGLVAKKEELEAEAAKLRIEAHTVTLLNVQTRDKLMKMQMEHNVQMAEMQRSQNARDEEKMNQIRDLKLELESKENKANLAQVEEMIAVVGKVKQGTAEWQKEPKEFKDMTFRDPDHYNHELADVLEKIFRKTKQNKMDRIVELNL